jgi:hypothetical protein
MCSLWMSRMQLVEAWQPHTSCASAAAGDTSVILALVAMLHSLPNAGVEVEALVLEAVGDERWLEILQEASDHHLAARQGPGCLGSSWAIAREGCLEQAARRVQHAWVPILKCLLCT